MRSKLKPRGMAVMMAMMMVLSMLPMNAMVAKAGIHENAAKNIKVTVTFPKDSTGKIRSGLATASVTWDKNTNISTAELYAYLKRMGASNWESVINGGTIGSPGSGAPEGVGWRENTDGTNTYTFRFPFLGGDASEAALEKLNEALEKKEELQAAQNALNAAEEAERADRQQAVSSAQTALENAQNDVVNTVQTVLVSHNLSCSNGTNAIISAVQEALENAQNGSITDAGKKNVLTAIANNTTSNATDAGYCADRAAMEGDQLLVDVSAVDDTDGEVGSDGSVTVQISQTSDGKTFPVNEAEEAAKALREAEDLQAAKAVEDKISKLPKAADVTKSDISGIEDAKNAYDALTDDQKKLVNDDLVKKLEEAESAVKALKAAENAEAEKALEEAEALARAQDKKAAAEVEDMIALLPDPSNAGTGDKEKIEAARKALDALTDAQRQLVKNEAVSKLEAAEKALQAAEAAEAAAKALADAETLAEKVESMIAALPSTNVTLADKDSIEAARAAYNALNDEQKSKINMTTLMKLVQAESALAAAQAAQETLDNAQAEADQKAADAVTQQIMALPDAANVRLGDKSTIEAAAAAYDALTTAQKSKVSTEASNKLSAARSALQAAQNNATTEMQTDETTGNVTTVTTATNNDGSTTQLTEIKDSEGKVLSSVEETRSVDKETGAETVITVQQTTEGDKIESTKVTSTDGSSSEQIHSEYADGKVVDTSKTVNADGSGVETNKTINADKTEVHSQTSTAADGSSENVTVNKDASGNTTAVHTENKDAAGNGAAVDYQVNNSGSGEIQVSNVSTTDGEGNVKIPETVQGADGRTYTVTTVGKGAFSGSGVDNGTRNASMDVIFASVRNAKNGKALKIELPSTIRLIRNGAFDGANIKKITINVTNASDIRFRGKAFSNTNAKMVIRTRSKKQYNKVVEKIKKAGGADLKTVFKKLG